MADSASQLDRQRRINEIQELAREPAIEVWSRLGNREEIDEILDGTGFSIEYFQKLVADEFIRQLLNGTGFSEFPYLPEMLADFCWRSVITFLEKNNHVDFDSFLWQQLRLRILQQFQIEISIESISLRNNLSVKRTQSLIMLALLEDGLTLEEIGSQFSVTRERVRQVVSKFGVSVRNLRQSQSSIKRQNKLELKAAIDSWINTHPGCYGSEIATALNVQETEIKELCPQSYRRLVLGGSPKKSSESYQKFSRTQIIDALKLAYEIRNPSMAMYSSDESQPLSGPYYDMLRRLETVNGPSQARIIQIFGTWKNACEEAGVPSLVAPRKTYELQWTNEELISHLAEFISTTTFSSVEGFDAWCRLSDDRPSSGTIRNQIGPWSQSYELALVCLRQRWA